MRAEASNLPIVFDRACARLGAAIRLDGVSLALLPGAPTVLIGPNGAGKSSLLHCAMGLLAPSSGCVSWGGGSAPRPARLAMLFQRPAMLRRSVAGNLAFALAAAGVPRRLRQSRIEALLAKVGLDGLAARPARRLSGGQQQRLALARALARAPDVLFLDEPTASLDPQATKAVEEIVAGIAAEGVKVVLATHDLGQARRLGGEIVFMLGGGIAERAPAAGFFAAPATTAARRFLAGELIA